jgi:hypothetical protein
MTSSNKSVTTKEVVVAPILKKKKPAKSIPETVKASEPERAVGGMQSDEDDEKERKMALSSPVKGSEYRKSAAVRCRHI